jgi:hypothetical protein
MQVQKRNRVYIKKYRYKSMILVPLAFNYFSVSCAGNETNNKNGKKPTGDSTHITATAAAQPAEILPGSTGNIADFTGSFRAACENKTGDYLQLTISKKATAYFAALKKQPANQLIASGILEHDTTSFLPEANIWSIHSKKSGTFAFALNKQEEEPCAHKNCPGYITLVSANAENIQKDNCFDKDKYLFFISTTAKLNPPPPREGNYKEELASLHNYIGNYQLDKFEDSSATCKGFISLTQKNNAYYLSLRFPRLPLTVSGLLKRDTVNFDADFNVWTLKDRQQQVYGFLFDKDRPTQIILINEDAKEIFERNCVVGKEILFTRKN